MGPGPIFLDRFFLNKMKAGLVYFFRLDALQTPEVFGYTISLFAGPAVKLFFNNESFSLPWGKVRWKSRAKESDDGC